MDEDFSKAVDAIKDEFEPVICLPLERLVVPGAHAISLPPNKITLFGRFFLNLRGLVIYYEMLRCFWRLFWYKKTTITVKIKQNERPNEHPTCNLCSLWRGIDQQRHRPDAESRQNDGHPDLKEAERWWNWTEPRQLQKCVLLSNLSWIDYRHF